MEDNYWHVVPVLKIDRKIYKGRGRPCKKDYYTDSGQLIPRWPKDGVILNVAAQPKGIVISIGA